MSYRSVATRKVSSVDVIENSRLERVMGVGKLLRGLQLRSDLVATGGQLNMDPQKIDKMQTLDLSGKGIGVQMEKFCTALSTGELSSLTILDLSDNRIGDEGMKAFSEALSRGVLASLTVLDLSDNRIGDEGMKAFSTALSSGALGSLVELWLHDNKISRDGMSAFAQEIARGSLASLEDLYIHNNDAASDAVIAAVRNRAVRNRD